MRVGIVGAGITGLALTHFFEARGVESVCLEAEDRPGGVVRSTRVDGRVIEHGPQRLRLTPTIAEMVETLGLEGSLRTAAADLPVFVYVDGALRAVPSSVRGFLATDLLSWRGKARVLAEPLTGPARPDDSVASFLRRKFGREAARNVLEPLLGGIYGGDPEEMPARFMLAPLIAVDREKSLLRAGIGRLRRGDRPPPATFDAGLAEFPERLAEVHADRVRLDAPVEGIEEVDGGYGLGVDGDVERVDRVVVTAAAPAAASVLESLDAATAAALESLAYNPLAVVHLSSDVERRGLGYQVGRSEGLRTLGVTWNAGMFDRDGVYTGFIGGASAALLDRTDDDLGAVVREEFEAVMGASASVIGVTRLDPGVPAWDWTWTALESIDPPAGVSLATNYTARMGIPSRIAEARALADRLADEDG